MRLKPGKKNPIFHKITAIRMKLSKKYKKIHKEAANA